MGSSFADIWNTYDFSSIQTLIQHKTQEDVGRALGKQGRNLHLDDLQALLSPAAAPFLEVMAAQSQRITLARFGHVMQLFAPLYLSNTCENVCTYCGFSAQNRIPRKTLDTEGILAEAAILKSMGIDHVLLVTGESSRVGYSYLSHAVKLLRPMFSSISLEVQPLSETDYTSLAADGLSAVIVYQETYDRAKYAAHHIKGPKSDIVHRLETPDRLGRVGVKKVGIGALHGLSDWRAETWFLGLHLQYLEQTYWKTRYSISFPRLRPHAGGTMALSPFGERDLVQAICALRLFGNEVELTLSTRERPVFRDHATQLGITTMSAGAKTNPGGYASDTVSLEQFSVNDNRTVDEIVTALRRSGYEPVWKDWDATYDGYSGQPACG